jgi:hypothetical protein
VSFAPPVSTPPAKRTRDQFEAGDDSGSEEFGGLSSETERELAQLTDKSAQRYYSAEQPTAAAYETPAAQRTHNVLGGLPTPVSRNSLLIASEDRDAKRQRQAADTANADKTQSSVTLGASSGSLVPPLTPTPRRTGDPAAAGTPSRGGGGDDYEITEEVMALLAGQPLAEPARQAVRDTLNTYALRMVGVLRGRDMARTGLQKRDARIAELQERVLQLEARDSANRQKMQSVKAGLLNLYQEDG